MRFNCCTASWTLNLSSPAKLRTAHTLFFTHVTANDILKIDKKNYSLYSLWDWKIVMCSYDFSTLWSGKKLKILKSVWSRYTAIAYPGVMQYQSDISVMLIELKLRCGCLTNFLMLWCWNTLSWWKTGNYQHFCYGSSQNLERDPMTSLWTRG